MSIESTFEKVENDITSGDLGKARDRLHGLLRTYPDNLEVRRKLGEIYWKLQYPAMAGRYWYLEEPITPEMERAHKAFEDSCGNNPIRMLDAIKFRGDFNAIRSSTAGERITRLAERARKETGFTYRLKHGIEPYPYQPTRTENLQKIGCIAVVLALIALLVIGFVTVIDGKEEKQYDNIGNGSIVFSPDSRRLAYAAQSGNKRFVVADGKEWKHYDGVGSQTLVFSPDSKKLAYVALKENRQIAVINEKEISEYDGIVALEKGGFVFDAPDTCRYLAMKDKSIFLVETKVE